MDADHVLADPAGCGVLAGWPLLVWEGRLLGLERLSDAIRQGGIPQPPAGHDHPPGHEPLGGLEIEGGGQHAWLCQAPPAAFHLRLAWIPCQQGLGGAPVLVEVGGGEDDTPLRRHEGLMGGARRAQSAGPLGHHRDRGEVLSRAAPRARARPWSDGARGPGSRLPPRRQSRQGLLGIGGTGPGRAAERRQGLGFGVARLEPGLAYAPRCLGAALGCGAPSPAWGHAAIGGGPPVIASVLPQWRHRVRVRMDQRLWRCGHGGGDPGDPLAPRLPEGRAGLCPLEGAVGHEAGGAVGRLAWRDGRGDDLATVLHVAAMAAEGGQAEGPTRLVRPHEVTPDGGEVWTMLAAVATRAGHPLGIRRRRTVVAAIARETGAIERGQGRGQPQAWRRRGGHETVECRDPIGIEQIQGASPRVILERRGIAPGGDETRRRLVLKKQGHEIAWLVHTAEPLEDHRVDGAPPGDHAGRWRVLPRSVEDVAQPTFVKPPCPKTEMIHDLTPGSSGPRRLLSMTRCSRHTGMTHVDSGACGKSVLLHLEDINCYQLGKAPCDFWVTWEAPEPGMQVIIRAGANNQGYYACGSAPEGKNRKLAPWGPEKLSYFQVPAIHDPDNPDPDKRIIHGCTDKMPQSMPLAESILKFRQP